MLNGRQAGCAVRVARPPSVPWLYFCFKIPCSEPRWEWKASYVQALWGEMWARLRSVSWKVSCRVTAWEGVGENKRFWGGVILSWLWLTRGMLGVESYWKAKSFSGRGMWASWLHRAATRIWHPNKVFLCHGALSQRSVWGQKNKEEEKKNSQQKSFRKSSSWLMLCCKLWKSMLTIARCCARRGMICIANTEPHIICRHLSRAAAGRKL